jgi:CDP-diacylglycerol--glycerol-3-phosphate 3-phosphatidyltransferase
MKRNVANLITAFRILFSIMLLFCPALSVEFYVLYIAAGITDVLDGAVARKTKTESEFGARLDTASDFVFFAVCLIKLIPVLDFELWMYVSIIVVAVIKTVNIISGYIMFKRIVVAHTVMNKVTGVLMFALPFAVHFVELKYCAVPVFAAALFAAVQEGHYIRTGKWKSDNSDSAR